ncbi:hypothetical protein M9H77_27008 [Catharanthus roseus]|uniref:Uncharacterized protein n=1 Tax=Catharanthus roseus TaxID=4058 RepID=A0ACC0ACV6_CATRO|nr:hypothetical protein M9H77_27008 [Catharanthus roseus]
MPGPVQGGHPGCPLVTPRLNPLPPCFLPFLKVPFLIYPSVTHSALTRRCHHSAPFVCSVTVHLLCLGHLFGLISTVGFYRGGVIRFFLQQVVSEPRFSSSAPASVNNLSNLRSSSDPFYYYCFCSACRRAFTVLELFCFRLFFSKMKTQAWLESVRFQSIRNLGRVKFLKKNYHLAFD